MNRGDIMEQQILIMEDEERIQTLLKTYLEAEGYQVDVANDGLEGMKRFQSGNYQLILLDVMMPQIDGYMVLEMIRQTSNIPVMMITAMEKDEDQMKAFDLQADDYIIKPFTMELVLRRIGAVLRRTKTHIAVEDAKIEENILRYGELHLDTKRCKVFISAKVIATTKKEFELLTLLLQNPEQVFTREILLDKIWGYDFYGNPKIVNTHIQNLRKKLGGRYIEAVRGIGYTLCKEDKE